MIILWICLVLLRLTYLISQDRMVYKETLADRPKSPPLIESLAIVVIFRNTGNSIDRLVNAIIPQDYSGSWTLYLVSDGSVDQSNADAIKWSKQDPRIRYLSHDKRTPGKKGALQEVMSTCTEEWVLFTDADCVPKSKQWISTMMSSAGDDIDLILGASPYDETSPTWVHYDTISVFLSYISWALRGKPYMSVGRNVAVKADWWRKSGGVSRHLHKVGGDDDLTIQYADKRPRVSCRIMKESQTKSESPKSLWIFLKAKARHVSAGMSYRMIDQLVLLSLSIVHTFVIVGFLFLIYPYPILVGSLMLLYLGVVHRIINRWMNYFNIPWSWISTIINDAISPLLYAYIAIQAVRRNEKEW